VYGKYIRGADYVFLFCALRLTGRSHYKQLDKGVGFYCVRY